MDERGYLEREAFALTLGRSYERRRHPRVRGVKGRAGLYSPLLDGIRTRRAAFRRARGLRDAGELRPLVVYKLGSAWVIGARRIREGGNDG